MATLSAISKFLACYTWDRKGGGQESGSGITSWDNTALSYFFLANTYLEWCEQPEKNKQITIRKTKPASLEKVRQTERHCENIDSWK